MREGGHEGGRSYHEGGRHKGGRSYEGGPDTRTGGHEGGHTPDDLRGVVARCLALFVRLLVVREEVLLVDLQRKIGGRKSGGYAQGEVNTHV